MGALFGLWFIIWPILGSLLLKQGINAVFMWWVLFALFDTLILTAFLKETHVGRDRAHKVDLFGLKTIRKYLRDPHIAKYLRSMMIIGTWFFTYQSVLTIDTKIEFGVGGESFGYILALIGLVSAINMALLLPKFRLKNFSSAKLVTIAHLGVWVILAALTTNQLLSTSSFWAFVILISIQPLFASLLQPIYQSDIVKLTPKGKTGEVIGVSTSVNTIAMIVGPILGWLMLDAWLSIYIVALMCVVISFMVIKKRYYPW